MLESLRDDVDALAAEAADGRCGGDDLRRRVTLLVERSLRSCIAVGDLAPRRGEPDVVLARTLARLARRLA